MTPSTSASTRASTNVSPLPGFADALDRLPIAGPFKRFIIPQNIERFYPRSDTPWTPVDFARQVLRKLNVHHQVTPQDLARVPRTGPVVVVSNHPFGILEGLILFEMLSAVRPDVKILANSLLAVGFPEMRDALIMVDPFAQDGSAASNRRGVRELLSYLASGGLLIVFPAGEVSHLNLRGRRIEDPGWNHNISRFVRHTRAAVVPIYIKGANSLAFQLIGMIHSQLRTARLLHELVNKERKTVDVRIANPIGPDTLAGFSSDEELTRYLRCRTYLLRNRGVKPRVRNPFNPARPVRRQEPVADPAPQPRLEAEVSRLTRLAENGDLEVFRTAAEDSPNILHEIGRLREISFRAVGEGTGKSTDLDRFDRHYHHVFLWDRQARQVVGAYRLGMTAEILPRFGIDGLYTATLFHFDPAFFDRVGPAVEVGRSFVRQEYQKQYAPLLLLWKGIGAHVAQHPEHPVLFGPVSISNDYQPVSRSLIVRYLQASQSVKALGDLVKPRRKFHTRLRGVDNAAISRILRDSDELSSITADIETDGKGIPILLKQYLKLGGKLLAFNVDPVFSDALDGLILVDLRHTARAVLHRYMGREGSEAFLGYHQDVNPKKTFSMKLHPIE